MFTTTPFRHYMVKGQISTLLTAVLADISVTLENLMLGQFSLPSRAPDKVHQPDYRWDIKNACD